MDSWDRREPHLSAGRPKGDIYTLAMFPRARLLSRQTGEIAPDQHRRRRVRGLLVAPPANRQDTVLRRPRPARPASQRLLILRLVGRSAYTLRTGRSWHASIPSFIGSGEPAGRRSAAPSGLAPLSAREQAQLTGQPKPGRAIRKPPT